ncbi:acyltransferase [Dyella soli]|uniref:Acyltransferase n=1 Tax=Dyella soli TaxID=522319 RepID=A0A4R0YPR8_9GAMM|nr:acyltransferase [Dyella soli]TCI10947.1 acyltransferase [Dyella soli]
MADQIRHGIFLIIEKLLRWCIHPKLRGRLLALFGAQIGRNVRVSECQFINLRQGFSNLDLGDDVFIGPGCLIDLEGRVILGRGVTLAPRVQVITHSDPGERHASPLANHFPKTTYTVRIGSYSWIGAGATIMSGASIGDFVVVGAMTLVITNLDSGAVYVGVPARKTRLLDLS